MVTRCVWLLFLATSILPAGAQPAAPPASAAKRPIHISIENEYSAEVNFGQLGRTYRTGKDTANGVLEWDEQKRGYVGTVTAKVDSQQGISGLAGNCPHSQYEQTQELDVIGRDVGGFNDDAQNVSFNRATSTGSEGREYLLLTFTPNSDIPTPARDDNGQLTVACLSLIERPQGYPFMPFNDSRWTTPPAGYIIVLPVTGRLNYTDAPVAPGTGSAYAPVFDVFKSIWTVTVERLP